MKIEYMRIDDILPYQKNAGITVIPTLQWAEKETFSFCFDGIELGETVTVSTIGCQQ